MWKDEALGKPSECLYILVVESSRGKHYAAFVIQFQPLHMHAPIPWMRPWLLEIYTITCINTRKYTYDNGSLASDRFDFDQLKTTTKKTAKLEPSKTIYSLKSNSVTNTPAIKTSHEQSHFVFFFFLWVPFNLPFHNILIENNRIVSNRAGPSWLKIRRECRVIAVGHEHNSMTNPTTTTTTHIPFIYSRSSIHFVFCINVRFEKGEYHPFITYSSQI